LGKYAAAVVSGWLLLMLAVSGWLLLLLAI